MDKPFDLKALGETVVARAKERGLTVAEESVEVLAAAVWDGLIEWSEKSVQLTPTPVDNVLFGLIAYFEKQVRSQIEKIDLDGDGD